MRELIIILFSCILFSGCSFLKTIVAPLTPVQNTLPQEISKSKAKEICKGKVEFNEFGKVISCTRGYYSYGESYNEQERKLTFKEKVAQFITRSSGYLLIGLVLLFIFAPSIFGIILGRFIEGTIGITAKAGQMLVKGISAGKKYVRENGSKYTVEEQKIYQQGCEDMLQKITENITDKKVKELINKIRADI
jgi:hypothetical protein